jgi:hypothetical protein
VHIDSHAGKEKKRADNKLRRPEPTDFIVIAWRKIEEPTTLHKDIKHIEKEADSDNREGHFAFATHQRGKNKGSLQIVQLKEDKNEKSNPIKGSNSKFQ